MERNRGKQGDREWMKVQFFQYGVDEIASLTGPVCMIEDVARGPHRQSRNVYPLAIRGDCGDAGRDTETNVVGSTGFLYHSIYLSSVRPLRVEDGFGVFKDYEHIFRR
jgi:hypothetical protein